MFRFFGFEFVHEILISITTERIPETGGGALCFLVSCFLLLVFDLVFCPVFALFLPWVWGNGG